MRIRSGRKPDQGGADHIARTASLAGLQIYFDCGSEDDYGFDVGAVALDKMLASRHIPHEFHLYPGGHNWVYVAEHLPALLQFHFRVFESASRRRNSPQ
jgi:S-formylglutathione hydrolase FrmB